MFQDSKEKLATPFRKCAVAMQTQNPMYSAIFKKTVSLFEAALTMDESVTCMTLEDFRVRMKSTPAMEHVYGLLAENEESDDEDEHELMSMAKGFPWWKVAETLHMLVSTSSKNNNRQKWFWCGRPHV